MKKYLYVYNKRENKLSAICENYLEHDLSAKGGGGEKIVEFDLVNMNKRIIYLSDSPLSNILYLQ